MKFIAFIDKADGTMKMELREVMEQMRGRWKERTSEPQRVPSAQPEPQTEREGE